jgi:hypothetical protein
MTRTAMRHGLLLVLPTACALLAGCGAGQATTGGGLAGAEQSGGGMLPLGDGHVSSRPERGSVFSCQTSFPTRNGGPAARKTGPWIKGDQWDPNAKPHVDGDVRWPNASIDITVRGDQRVITANNLPKHPTGEFPIKPSDDAYEWDTNPNPINEQDILLRLPASPVKAAEPSCVPMGMIGFTGNGVAIYNALDIQGRDGGAHEVQDKCDGHPQRVGQYHYHTWSDCIDDPDGEKGKHSSLIGYAIDGFGIYGPKDTSGRTITNAGLDACHGHTGPVEWDGRTVNMYHYHFTAEYPYTIACFTGTPVEIPRGRDGASNTPPNNQTQPGGQPANPGNNRRPGQHRHPHPPRQER